MEKKIISFLFKNIISLKFFAMMRERERKTTHTQDRIEPMVELNIPAIYALFVLRSRRRKKDNEVFFSFREFLNNLRTRRATLFGENNNNLQKNSMETSSLGTVKTLHDT
jgi:hypothetical protein